MINLYKAISLIEIIVTMSILGILMIISFNSFATLQIESRRKEAHGELINLKANIEQMAVSGFVGSTEVRTVIDVAQELSNDNTRVTSMNGYYVIGVSEVKPDTNSYTLTATAQGAQAQRDSGCIYINLIVMAEQDPARMPLGCW